MARGAPEKAELATKNLPETLMQQGESGIRTHGTVTGSAVFKTAAFDRSAISPMGVVTGAIRRLRTAALRRARAHRPGHAEHRRAADTLIMESQVHVPVAGPSASTPSGHA